MRYPVVKAADARMYLIARRESQQLSPENLVQIRGEGPELDLTFVNELRAGLTKLRGRFSKLKKGGDEAAEFEAAASELVHELVPARASVIADSEFWLWLALVHFHDLIEWRYGSSQHGADWKNFGVGAASENLLYRLWLRGELGYDPVASDKYVLAKRGDIDFWRSHLFRQSYANAKAFAKALIRFQYPYDDPAQPRLKIAVIRELVKRLRRLRANLVIELLDEPSATEIIRSEAEITGSTT